MKSSAFTTVFAAAYAIVYFIAVKNNYALFTYHPSLAEFGWGVQPPKDGPAMYWYGWMATAGIAASLSALIASAVPQRIAEKIAPCWAWGVPLAVIVVIVWMLRGYFFH